MKKTRFSEKIEIKCSPEFAFDYTQDYEKRLTWDTFLKSAILTEGANAPDVGVKAYCVAKNGLGMGTEYLSFNRPKTAAIKMINGPFMFKSFFGTWTFKKVTENTTEVVFLYSYQLRFPFSIIEGYINRKLHTNVKQRLLTLKQSIEQLH